MAAERPGTPAPRLRRKDVLASAAALLLGVGGCQRGPRRIAGPPSLARNAAFSSSAVAQPVQLWMDQAVNLQLSPSGQAALKADVASGFPAGSALHFATGAARTHKGAAVAALPITGTGGYGGPVYGMAGLVPLDATLRLLNWDLTDPVTEAAMAPLRTPAGLHALPFAWNVVRIAVPKAVAAREQLTSDTRWTLDQFIGLVHRLSKADPPTAVLGGTFGQLAEPPGYQGRTNFIAPYVWLAFAHGFGGSIVNAAGRLSLTGEGTLAGLRTLVDLLRLSPATGLPTLDGALNLTEYDPGPAFLTLPYPTMPVRPVLPFVTAGWGVAASPEMAPSTQFQAVRWLTMLYGRGPRKVLAGCGITLATQVAFAEQPTGAYTRADLFAPYPALPLQTDGSRRYLQAIGAAVAEAVQNPTQLPGLLSHVEETTNPQLAAAK